MLGLRPRKAHLRPVNQLWGKTAVPHTTRQTYANRVFRSFLPRRGGSMAPCVNTFGEKEVREGLYGGILMGMNLDTI
jgi:hypothetical protein